MTGYLTNTKLENKARCEYAAKVSGFDVVFVDNPMPRDVDSHDCYDPKRLIGTHDQYSPMNRTTRIMVRSGAHGKHTDRTQRNG